MHGADEHAITDFCAASNQNEVSDTRLKNYIHEPEAKKES